MTDNPLAAKRRIFGFASSAPSLHAGCRLITSELSQ
jgi:hypothetical protein